MNAVLKFGFHVHCNRLQQTATDCNRLQQTATDCNRLQQTATNLIFVENAVLEFLFHFELIFFNEIGGVFCFCDHVALFLVRDVLLPLSNYVPLYTQTHT